MTDDFDIGSALSLSSTRRREIFETEILPAIGANGEPIAEPTFAVVSGQPGAGKSTIIRQISGRFGEQATQVIIADDLNAYIPGNNAALLKGSHALRDGNSLATTEWYDGLFYRSVQRRSHIILESCYPPHQYRLFLDHARSNGYKTELNIVATDRITSFTAIHDRFEKALEKRFLASTVLPDAETHNHYYSVWPRVAFEVEKKKLFDKIAIVSRDGTTIFENELVAENNGSTKWKQRPDALRVLLNVRNRPLHTKQQAWVASVWDKLAQSRTFSQHPESACVPVARYRSNVALGLREHSSLGAHQLRSDYLKEFSEMFIRNISHDVEFIIKHKSKRDEFEEQTFERGFLEQLKSVAFSLKEASVTTFEKAIKKSNAEKDASGCSGTVYIGDGTGNFKRPRNGPYEERVAAGVAPGGDHRPVKPDRPKFLVEVSKHVFRPIEEYNQMARDPVKYPTVMRDRRKLNVLILAKSNRNYETPASLQARSEREKSDLIREALMEAKLPYILATRTIPDLPMVLVDVGNGKTFIAGEKFPLQEGGRRIPGTISADRILVRNEQGGFNELSQRLAEGTERALPLAAVVQLGWQQQNALEPAPGRNVSLKPRDRSNSFGRS
ncbi:zeta toxin family protein [Agrobacterium larrymoorei]|uniref:Zeta toxin family protein n=1 Tax=Agrobacterium larrymoorei TaxID=160699 RepID=A0A4D7E0A4_9HYPH|nr:zeta toxin family protein [Agrobacterium larrymoorei]QCJ00968.1 hypothetical protein CFBP5473_23610 [Agrobacterium larrymoorei]QYA10306.1 zeta toxin family protein [Agrobacterium larrymoorei]